jgi:hypothetical protein
MTRAGACSAAAWLTALALALAACAHQGVELAGPPIPVPPGLTEAQVADAIRTAVRARSIALGAHYRSYVGGGHPPRWMVEKDQPGRMLTGMYIRRHYLQIEVRYSARQVVTTITDSDGLDQDGDSIHPQALQWQRGFEETIAGNLKVAAQ